MTSINGLLLVAVGGAFGAVTRCLVGDVMKSLWPSYAASGTLIVNVVGSLLIGLLLGASLGPVSDLNASHGEIADDPIPEFTPTSIASSQHIKERNRLSDPLRLLIVTGFLGGFTTFSSLAFETARFASKSDGGSLQSALSHLSANVLMGLVAVWFGVWLRK